MSDYDKVRSQQQNNEQQYRNTLARIEQIQTQFQAPAPKLRGKVAVITGVGSLKGIGRATAILFAREGASHLYLIDYDGTNLPDLKSTITAKFPSVKVTAIKADAADEAAIAGVCEQAIKEEGRLDVFFANAGYASMDTLENTTPESFMNSMRINALSVFLAVKHASAAMKKTSAEKPRSGGSIILTASSTPLY